MKEAAKVLDWYPSGTVLPVECEIRKKEDGKWYLYITIQTRLGKCDVTHWNLALDVSSVLGEQK